MLRLVETLTWVCACCLAIAWVTIAVAPEAVERNARPHILRMVEDEALRRYPALQEMGAFGGLTAAVGSEVTRARHLVSSKRPEVLAQVLGSLCKHDCPKPALAAALRGVLQESLSRWGVALERVENWSRGYYEQLVANVLGDLRIFLGTNCALLCLAGFCLRANVGALRTRIGLSAILVATTMIGAYAYFFLQDWLLTLIFSTYVGLTYVAWVAVVAAILVDVAFNKGRVVQAVVGAVQYSEPR